MLNDGNTTLPVQRKRDYRKYITEGAFLLFFLKNSRLTYKHYWEVLNALLDV